MGGTGGEVVRNVRMAVALALILASVMLVGPTVGVRLSYAATGIVDLCFLPEDLGPVAGKQARLAARDWDSITPGLRISFEHCLLGSRAVPMTPGPAGGDGALAFTDSRGDRRFGEARITYDVDAIRDFGAELGSEEKAWRIVACHEIGHVLGLEHSADPQSCMRTRAAQPVEVPGAGDIAWVQRVYGKRSS